MSVIDFLFEGKPPKSVTTYGQTVENIPKWMSDYTQGLIARANAAAAEPYIPYGGPRIAGFTPEQQAAFGLAEEQVGAYQPYIEGGLEQTMAATRGFPEAAQEYMDPYIENVLKRQESLATRTLEEEFLPQLQRTFAGVGQLGSRGGRGSMEDIGVRGIRDIQEGLEEQRLAALSGAYGQAADIYGRDVGRQLEAGRQIGALGEAAQAMGMRDIGLLEAIGQQEQQLGQRGMDLAYQDFLEQRDLPFQRLGFMSDIIRGLPAPRTMTTTETGPSPVYQPSPLSQAIGAYGVYRGLRGDAKGGYKKKYQIGGPVFGGLSRAAMQLRPDFGRTIGVSGGHNLTLAHKQQ